MENEADILHAIRHDYWMMETLEAARSLNKADWWICAGFVRTKVWDVLHGYTKRTSLPDIDFIYFDDEHTEESIEKEIERLLMRRYPGRPWSVKNQARMHVVNQVPPYTSASEAISKFPETASAVGVKLDGQGELQLTAPWGIQDLLMMKLRPTPFFAESTELMPIYEGRIERKNWKEKWPLVERA
jgi:hypothetical protein